MNRSIVLLLFGVPLVVLLAWRWGGGSASERRELTASGLALQEEVPPPPTSVSTDAEEVFKRAFWRRPSEGDAILHAERREWADEDGVDRWQWFIEVDPSTELARYLHEQNPFRLVTAESPNSLPVESSPDWFPSEGEGFETKQSPDGQMLFLIREGDGRLFAASQGRGFAKAVESPSASRLSGASTPDRPAGRLPPTSPPNPNSP